MAHHRLRPAASDASRAVDDFQVVVLHFMPHELLHDDSFFCSDTAKSRLETPHRERRRQDIPCQQGIGRQRKGDRLGLPARLSA